ncbi:MAG TPA: hypothetical protein VGU43_00660, partial [Thermoplasmata archaeon]|nr:hypothetical protein [Thermoplasmata archaeon]
AQAPSVGLAAILHLVPSPTPEAPLAEWMRHREEIGADEAAAWVAGLVQRDPGAWDRFRAFRARLLEAYPKARGSSLAAAQLTELSQSGADRLPEVIELAAALGPQFPLPLLSAALLLAGQPLSPTELADWVLKAERIAHDRQLAPTAPELAALAVALVHGLPAGRWAGGSARAQASPLISTLLVLHAGIYRSALAGTQGPLAARAG